MTNLLSRPLALATCLLLAACELTPLPTTAGAVEGESCAPVRVIDGDTFTCRAQDGSGALLTIRLLAVDTPERDQGTWGTQVTAHVTQLLGQARTVSLVFDVERLDRYGWVLLPDGTALNLHLVEQGFATALTVSPNRRYERVVEFAQVVAQRERKGLWAEGLGTCTPSAYRQGGCM
jgi:micrococcal nuclease